jgi:hypothetical protein
LRKSLLRRIGHEVVWSAMPRSLEFEPYTSALVVRETKSTVRSGPFRGMKYLKTSSGSVLAPKLLGIYERELHQAIEEAIASPIRRIVDIGAAEGYYCTGFAMRMPRAKVVAYEIDEPARVLIAEMACLNEVSDRVEIRGACTVDELNSVLDASVPTLVICDAEGAEAYLLDPLRVPALRTAYILVEMHDVILGGLSGVIRQRFEGTHRIEQIRAEARSRSEFPFSSFITRRFPGYVDYAVSDCRPPGMSWFWMRPKHSDG